MSLNRFRWGLAGAFLLAGGLTLTGAAAAPPGDGASPSAGEPDPAERAKEIFKARCFECHGGVKVSSGVKILDRSLLVDGKKLVVPRDPEASKLFQLITGKDEPVMPDPPRERLNADEIDGVRRWIAAGAPPFPADVAPAPEANKTGVFKDKNVVGVEHVLQSILAHVQTLKGDGPKYYRYFSVNHLLTAGPGGATREELNRQADALAKAVNHLSLGTDMVRPIPIDPPTNSVFAVDIRQLGWDRPRFTEIKDRKPVGAARLNFFDLVLLEYPYGVIYEDSDAFDRLARDFLIPAGQVRPVPYVRADWFVSTATLPPLYNDLLELPANLTDLEARLDVHENEDVENFTAKRAAMTVSGVSNNNRAVERHPANPGAFWKSFDYKTSKGPENIFKDPIKLHPAGGEMIFNLPNNLQGYFVVNNKDERLDAAVTEIVTDKFAQDRTVRTGLSCIRCHDKGMKDFVDAMRPAIDPLGGSPGFSKATAKQLYPGQSEMDEYLKEDREVFQTALHKALGHPQGREPLIPVTHNFLDEPLQLSGAAAELGLSEPADLRAAVRLLQFTALGLEPLAAGSDRDNKNDLPGAVRRDMWEDYFDQVVRQLSLGMPVVPLDGLTRRDFHANALDVEVTTNKEDNVFHPGDPLWINVTNKTNKDLYIELIYTGANGNKALVPLKSHWLPALGTCRFPAADEAPIGITLPAGKDQITLYASDKEFPLGRLLRAAGETRRGYHVADRVVHPFYELDPQGPRPHVVSDVDRTIVKKTIDVETTK